MIKFVFILASEGWLTFLFNAVALFLIVEMVCSEGGWTNCSCNCIRRRRKSFSGVSYSSVAFKIYSFFS